MPRYIDADILKDLYQPIDGKDYNVNMAIIRANIDDTPTADVQEVKHGEWKDDEEDIYWGNYIVKQHCSECGYTPHFDRETELFYLSKYCPNCGAKMDGEKNE